MFCRTQLSCYDFLWNLALQKYCFSRGLSRCTCGGLWKTLCFVVLSSLINPRPTLGLCRNLALPRYCFFLELSRLQRDPLLLREQEGFIGKDQVVEICGQHDQPMKPCTKTAGRPVCGVKLLNAPPDQLHVISALLGRTSFTKYIRQLPNRSASVPTNLVCIQSGTNKESPPHGVDSGWNKGWQSACSSTNACQGGDTLPHACAPFRHRTANQQRKTTIPFPSKPDSVIISQPPAPRLWRDFIPHFRLNPSHGLVWVTCGFPRRGVIDISPRKDVVANVGPVPGEDSGRWWGPALPNLVCTLGHCRVHSIGWLHVCDQGITAVFLGGLFHLVLCDRTLARNEELRCAWLWAEVQEFYRNSGTTDKLHNLTVRMIKPKKGSIELSGSVAQVRALVPFALQLVESWEDGGLDLESLGAKEAMKQLAICYRFLSPALETGSLLDHALGFQQLLQNLHAISPKRWQLRPKLHMFLELAAKGSNPSSSWNYREESFGGSLARQAHVRVASLALWPWALPCWPNFVARRHCQSCCLLIEVHWWLWVLVCQKKSQPPRSLQVEKHNTCCKGARMGLSSQAVTNSRHDVTHLCWSKGQTSKAAEVWDGAQQFAQPQTVSIADMMCHLN